MAVATPPTAGRLYTVEEFFELVPDGQKADLIDGVIYMASPDSNWNDIIGGFLYTLMSVYAEERDLGEVKGTRFAFVLGPRRAPEPDVSFVSGERPEVIQPTRGVGPPDIAVEIVAEDSKERDHVLKKRLYEETGVREYWLLDPLQDRYQFFRLRDGQYELMPLDQDRYFHSEALPGFWLDVEWLRSRVRPRRLECLNRILAGPPPQST